MVTRTTTRLASLLVLLALLGQGATISALASGEMCQLSGTLPCLPLHGVDDDQASVEILFSIDQEQHSSKSWVFLAGLGGNQHDTPDLLALVYEVNSTSWFDAQARLLLVGTEIPAEHAVGSRAQDSYGHHMVLANLASPLEDHTLHRIVFGYDHGAGEVSVSISDVDNRRTIYEGYLPIRVAHMRPFLSLGGVRALQGPGGDLSVTVQEVAWLPGAYDRSGLPVTLNQLQWHFTVQSDGLPARKTRSYRYGEGELVGIHVEWPQTPVAGCLVLTLGNTAVEEAGDLEREIIRLPWSREPQDVSIDSLLPLGRYEITLSYEEGLTRHLLGKEPVEIVRGIQSVELTIPREIWGVEPVEGSLRVLASQELQNLDVEVIAVPMESRSGISRTTVMKACIPVVRPGDNRVPFSVAPLDLGGQGDVLVFATVWGMPQGEQQRITLQSGWNQGGLELVGVKPDAFQRLGWVAAEAPGLGFRLINRRDQPVSGSVRAVLTDSNTQPGHEVSTELVPIPMPAFGLGPGDSVSFSLGTMDPELKGWHELQIVVDVEGDASIAIPIGSYYVGLPGRTEKELQIVNGGLHIGGRPTYLRGIGFYDFTLRSPAEWKRDLCRYADWGMNLIEVFVVPGAGSAFGQFLDVAEAAGVYVTGDIHWRRIWELDWSSRHRALMPYLAHWDHPNLVAWVLRDDSMYVWHYPELLKMRDFIRQFDTETLITTTMFDPRYHLEPPHSLYGLTPKQWDNYASLLDFPTPYEYPLLRRSGGVFAPMPGTQGGLDVVQVLAERTRDAYRDPNLYMWTWVQAHSQRVTISKLDFSYRESYTATPDQLRLLTYQMITAGIRGLLYYRDYFFEDLHYGMGRRHEMKLTWNTLNKVELFIATGQRSTLLSGISGVEAVQFSLGSEQVVLLVQHRFADVVHVATGSNGPLRLNIPVTDSSSQAYLLSPLGVAELSSTTGDGILTVSVPAFDLTAVLLVTSDEERVADLAAAYAEEMPEAARSALFILVDSLAKAEGVSQFVPESPTAGPTLKASMDAYARAIEHYTAGEWALAYAVADATRESLRRLGQSQLDAAKRSSHPGARRYLESYFSLPQFYGYTDVLPMAIDRELARVLTPLGGPEWPDVRAWHE